MIPINKKDYHNLLSNRNNKEIKDSVSFDGEKIIRKEINQPIK